MSYQSSGHRIAVLIPAHNEASGIANTLRSLAEQTYLPDRVIVVCDNCTDDTAAVARGYGAEVVETVDNTEKKAGALNQVLSNLLLPKLDSKDFILVMDADGTLSPEFIQTALAKFDNPRLGAVGAVFYGEPGGGFVGTLQRMEYHQFAAEISRKAGRTMVLSGTATVFRVSVLNEVAASRGDKLPGRSGIVYNTMSLTEDNELTLAIKTLGWAVTSPDKCMVTTEIMPTWGALYRQRLRWKRGTLEDLRNYGITKVTRSYYLQQIELFLAILFRLLFVVMTLTMIGTVVVWQPFWTLLNLVFIIVPAIGVWRMGWKGILLAMAVVPQLIYQFFQEGVLIKAYYDLLRRSEAKWHHVTTKPGEEVA